MWRAFFLAIGISLCILGAECFVVEKAVFNLHRKKQTAAMQLQTPSYWQVPDYLSIPSSDTREFEPPDWAPWALLASGAAIALYSVTAAKDG